MLARHKNASIVGLASSASADNGNRLIAVDDEVSLWSELDDFRDNGYYYHQHGQAEYDYDYNGNMVFDLHREMKIEYTQTTNLPKIIGWRRGTIENHYTFDGQKLGKKVYDYRGNLTLNERYFDELLMQNGKVRRLQHADGYISLTQDGNPVEYFYYLKDHLGNIRATITQATPDSLLITQANDYYPFGMAYTPKITGLQPDSWNNKFKYNGKEEQEMPGGWLSRKLSGGARMYDPTLGRWHVVDPMSENHFDFTPYNYTLNNPLLFIDPFGMDTVNVNNDTPIKKDDVVVMDDGSNVTSNADEVEVTGARENDKGGYHLTTDKDTGTNNDNRKGDGSSVNIDGILPTVGVKGSSKFLEFIRDAINIFSGITSNDKTKKNVSRSNKDTKESKAETKNERAPSKVDSSKKVSIFYKVTSLDGSSTGKAHSIVSLRDSAKKVKLLKKDKRNIFENE
jgi:RHS repeat-associated protein